MLHAAGCLVHSMLSLQSSDLVYVEVTIGKSKSTLASGVHKVQLRPLLPLVTRRILVLCLLGVERAHLLEERILVNKPSSSLIDNHLERWHKIEGSVRVQNTSMYFSVWKML